MIYKNYYKIKKVNLKVVMILDKRIIKYKRMEFENNYLFLFHIFFF